MRLRPVILCTLAVGLVAGGAALGAPKPVCNLIVDPEGDGRERLTTLATGGNGTVSSQALDILGADVATGKKEFVGIIRVKSTQTAGDPLAYAGIKWSLAFQINGLDHSFSVSRSPSGMSFRDTTSSTIGGKPGQGVVATVDGTSITFRMPRSSIPALKKAKQTLVSLSAMTYVGGGPSDTATGTGHPKYVDLTPSCLKPS